MSDNTWPYREQRGRVRLVIWRNTDEQGRYYYSTEVFRRYNASKVRDAPPQWKTTYKMDEQDLTDAYRLYDLADRIVASSKQADAEQADEAA